jgi:hypothetical protein
LHSNWPSTQSEFGSEEEVVPKPAQPEPNRLK